MASSISTLITEMQASLTAEFPLLTYSDGERELHTQGMPPRISWVDGPSTYGPPEKRSSNPRALATRNATLVAFIWGADRAGTELLLNAVHRAAYAAAYGSLMVTGDEWPQPDWLTNGRLCTLSLTFQIPVPALAKTTVVPTHFTLTAGTPGDGILEPGET